MGLQALVHTLGKSSWSALQVDIKNAFNTEERDDFLTAARDLAPTTYNFLAFAYLRLSFLLSGDQVILSAEGAQQGCLLGPAAFGLGLQPLLLTWKRAVPLLWNVSCLDD